VHQVGNQTKLYYDARSTNHQEERITLSPNRNSLFCKRVMLKQIVT